MLSWVSFPLGILGHFEISNACTSRGTGTMAAKITTVFYYVLNAGRPGSQEVSMYPLTRWDVSSIPANGIFLTKKLKTKTKSAQRVEND